jgi:hypothetical protein
VQVAWNVSNQKAASEINKQQQYDCGALYIVPSLDTRSESRKAGDATPTAHMLDSLEKKLATMRKPLSFASLKLNSDYKSKKAR